MISRTITLPELGLISGTRAALGAGVALLLADRLNDDQRRAVGWTLLSVGVLSTIPLLAEILPRRSAEQSLSGRNSSRAREGVLAGL